MSSPNPSDPRLLLPDWLRDGDSLDAPIDVSATPVLPTVVSPVTQNVTEPLYPGKGVVLATPYSERLSLDTQLDPGQLVTAADLPSWLGGLGVDAAEPTETNRATSAAPAAAGTRLAIAEPEPYHGADAPEDGVIDIEVNGWYAIAGALGLLILLAAALRLYLS